MHFDRQAERSHTATSRNHASCDGLQNLDEVAVPPPVQNEDEDLPYWHEDLEARRARDEGNSRSQENVYERNVETNTPQSPTALLEWQGLTEVAMAQPLQDQGGEGWRRQSHLESAEESADTIQPQAQSATPSDSPRSSNDILSSEDRPKWLTMLYTISYLIIFSLLGTLARLGVAWINTYPGAPITTPVLWSNVGGSLVLGFLAEDRRFFEEATSTSDPEKEPVQAKRRRSIDPATKETLLRAKKVVPLYVGLSTGFCGSFTSFSTWQSDAFLALSNDVSVPLYHDWPRTVSSSSNAAIASRNGGYSFEAVVGVLLYTTGLSVGALKMGAHIALFTDRWTPTLSFTFVKTYLDPIVFVLGWGCWAGAIALAVLPPSDRWRGEILFALVFAPVGCLLRFVVSLKLNAILVAFPLGTFVVNIVGCAIEAMCYDLQRLPLSSGDKRAVGSTIIGCQVLQGVMDGFCGCLTTVSTWVAELTTLRRKHSYVYGLLSLACGLGTMVAIMGAVKWSVGWRAAACTL